MAVISFADSVGRTVAFDSASDILTFGTAHPAGALLFEVSGNDLVVRNGIQWVRLATTTFGSLTGANFQFADGGLALFDAPGAQTLTGTSSSDYMDIGTAARMSWKPGAGTTASSRKPGWTLRTA